MKRFVKEFANSCIHERYRQDIKDTINSYVKACEKGLITDYECVKCIVQYKESLYNTVVTK